MKSRVTVTGTAIVSDKQLEAGIREMPKAFTILDYIKVLERTHPEVWEGFLDRYGPPGSGSRYTVLTYVSNRLSAYSRRKEANMLEPTPSFSPRTIATLTHPLSTLR